MVTTKVRTGCVVFWTLAAFADRARLKGGWNAAGFAHAVPDERENVSVLRDALAEVFGGSRFLVRPLSARNGFTVVREVRGEDENTFATVLTAKVFGSELPTIAGDQSKSQEVLAAYARHAGRVTSQQVSAALVRILQELGGTRLRPSGSVYWLPGDQADAWRAVTQAVESAADGGTSVGYVISHELDADSVVAVRDAIVHEVVSEGKRLMDEILTGDLGERAIKTRKAEAAELRRKVVRYEEILGVGLSHLKKALDDVEQTNASAALLLAADPFGQPSLEVSCVATA